MKEERKEGGGGGFAFGHTFGVRVDGPLARGLWPPDGGRLCIASLRGQRPFGPRVVVSPLRAMNIKSALRDLLSVPYGMISILIIGLLRSSPKEETHSLGRSPICLFFLGRKPGCEGFIQTGAFYNLKAPYLASAAVLYTSRGRKPGARPGGVSRSRTEPLAPRAKGPAAPSTLARERPRSAD